MNLPPKFEFHDHWLTPREVAVEYGRCLRRVQQWCKDGTMQEFGFLVLQDPSRRLWIKRIRETTL